MLLIAIGKIKSRQKMMSKQNGEITDDMRHKYIGNEYKNLSKNIFKFGLMDEHLHLTNFDN